MKPLDIAIEHAGGVTKLATLIGVGQSVISNWRKRDSVIDPLLCTAIEHATDGRITRQDLRPEDWQKIWPELVTPTPDPECLSDAELAREKAPGTRMVPDAKRELT